MIRRIPSLLRYLGPKWVAMRLWFALEHRLGLLRRRAPAGDWADFAGLSPVGPRVTLIPSGADAAVDREADELREGQLRLFSGRPVIVGSPPAWHRSPINGAEWPADRHWSLIDDAQLGDIKGVWEASRWSWAYALGRAYLRDRDPRHAELFWSWAEDWMAKNPPNVGVNWKCGQEVSFRLFAAAWALAVFADAPSTTPSRAQLLARLAHVTGVRIEAHLGYAISQDNNHGISEAVGLLTAGVLWPELPEAPARRAKGLAVLSRLCDRLIAADGSFSQHSSNYHRVLLDDLCWAAAVARAGNIELPANVTSAARRAADFLHALLLPDGSVVRYGADDGARVLQLTSCSYEDFRPTLAACAAAFGSPSLPAGPWDRQVARLGFGVPSGDAAPVPARLAAGGVHMRRPSVAVTVAFRAPTRFRFRPSHADQLHLYVRDADGPVVEDPGTLSYNDPDRRWADLAAARFHNVPMVDDLDPMTRVSRFLWLPWTTCAVDVDAADRVAASHRGFAGFVVRREVVIRPGAIRVTDTFEGDREASLSVRWHGRDRRRLEALRISSATGGGDTWHSASDATGLGIFADRYASSVPSHCRIFSLRARSATIVTEIPISAG